MGGDPLAASGTCAVEGGGADRARHAGARPVASAADHQDGRRLMARKGFIRTAVPGPPQAEGEIQLPDPGELNRPIQSKPPTWVWVAIFVVAAAVLMIMLYRSGIRPLYTGSFFIFPVMLMSMLMMVRSRAGGGDKNMRPAAINYNRAQYLRKLDEIRAEV